MPRPSRQMAAAIGDEAWSAPDALEEDQKITRVLKIDSNGICTVRAPDSRELLVVLPRRFRSTLWIRRGGFVLVRLHAADEAGKLQGEILRVVRKEKDWRKMSYWPAEFVKPRQWSDDEFQTGSHGNSDNADEDSDANRQQGEAA